MPEKIRLAKYLGHAGVCSRRAASRLIDAGRVLVNGRLANHIDHVDQNDRITVDGVLVEPPKEKRYLAYHKPVGIDCKLRPDDPSSLFHLLPPGPRIYPVGRLDKDSRGLLLLTNDGELCNRLIHPDHHQEKEYLVTVDRPLDDEFCRRMAEGVMIDGQSTLPCRVWQVEPTRFRIILRQGLNRQIRKMARACGYRVIDLYRERIARLNLSELSLAEGEFRPIKKQDIG